MVSHMIFNPPGGEMVGGDHINVPQKSVDEAILCKSKKGFFKFKKIEIA